MVAVLAWGALCFGGVYPWAYWPMATAAFTIGLWSLTAFRRPRVRLQMKLAVSLAVVAVAIAVQLVPVAPRFLTRLSPKTLDVVGQYKLVDPITPQVHPISINPRRTATAFVVFLSLATLLTGLSMTLGTSETEKLVRGLIVLGVVLSLVGIIQRSMFNGKIYGFWVPENGLLSLPPALSAFGPFINRNHFAGWMLMAIPLSLGFFAARLSSAMRRVGPGLRNRVLWLSTPAASETILVAFAILLMSLSLVMTISRSGITAFLITALLCGAMLVTKQRGRSKQALMAAYLAILVWVSLSWAGLDDVAGRFSRASVDIQTRFDAWDVTLRIAQDFPVFGSGINTYGTATLFYPRAYIGTHLQQAHSDYLQLVAEGGILVGVPVMLAIVAVVATARQGIAHARARGEVDWIRLGALASLFAIGLQVTIEFSLQMPANAALFVVTAAIATRAPQDAAGAKHLPL